MEKRPTFKDYESAGYGGELLPIAPPGAPLSPYSDIDPGSVGKIPMRRGPRGWAGLINWAKESYDSTQTAAFQASGAGIGIQGRSFPALDIDVLRPDVAEAVERLALELLGDAPIRVGRAPKRLLVYRGNVAPRSLSFCLPDEPGLAAGEKAERHLVEVLGRGRHWVAEGIHPKTGQPYSWATKRRPAGKLVEIDETSLDAFFAALTACLAQFGATETRGTGGARHERSAPAPETLLQTNLELVKEALCHIPNHGADRLEFDEWFGVLAKLKGLSGGSDEVRELARLWSSGELTGGQDEGNDKYDEDDLERRWKSIDPPLSGWPHLLRVVEKKAGAEVAERLRIEGAPTAGPLSELDAAIADLSRKYVYREPTREWVRVADARIMKPDAFSDSRAGQRLSRLDLADQVERAEAKVSEAEKSSEGDAPAKKSPTPPPKARSAHNILKGRAPAVQDLTYAPAKPKLFDGACGLVLNIYTPPERTFAANPPTDADVAPFLELMDWVFPDEQERTFVLDWMGHIAQHPGRKVQYAPVLFSEMQGVGKDTVLKVLRYGVVGEQNMASIAPARIDGEFNADWAPKQVVLVTELPSFQKRDLYDKLKDYVASGAGSLSVNPKGLARFDVPNSHCWVFTTNKPDALALDVHDRRFVVLHARESRMPADLRDRVNAFFDWSEDTQTGSRRGYLLAGEWLRRRAVSESFDPYECALVTEATKEMRKNARSPLEEVLEDALEERRGPFATELTLLQEVMAWLPPEVTNRARPTERRVTGILTRSLRCRSLGRPALGKVPAGCSAPANYNPRQMTLLAVAKAQIYEGMSDEALRAEFWRQRAELQAAASIDQIFDPPSPANEGPPPRLHVVASAKPSA
jgi:hypothetical protein